MANLIQLDKSSHSLEGDQTGCANKDQKPIDTPKLSCRQKALSVIKTVGSVFVTINNATSSLQNIDLSPDQIETLSSLKTNFESREKKLKTGLRWEDAEKYLTTHLEGLASLKKLVDRGGEPTLVGNENGKFQFDELCVESPNNLRNLTRDEAAQRVKHELGARLMNHKRYNTYLEKGLRLNIATCDHLDNESTKGRPVICFGSNGKAVLAIILEGKSYMGVRCETEV